MISDGSDEAIGLAGVMGGQSSEIGPDTSALLLEAAQFAPLVIGKAAARHGLRTEASQRFWRGVDPLGLDRCADRVIELIQSAARLASAVVPLVKGFEHELAVRPRPYEPKRVFVGLDRVNALLGTDLSIEEVTQLLSPIGFDVKKINRRTSSTCSGCSCRVIASTSRDVDVMEEVARHYGYEHIVARDRRSPFVGQLNKLQLGRRSSRRCLGI